MRHHLVTAFILFAGSSAFAQAPAFIDQPEMTPKRKDVTPFEYVKANVPFYPAGQNWGTLGQPIVKMQKPLSPEESLKHMVTPVGFAVKLFASEPQIRRPLCMAWDEQGRCWIAESADYPNSLQPEGKGNDRITICADTDGDGKADKFTVFADKLSIPTSIAFAHGGIVVTQAPHTLFLKDTDGDDKADVRTILFTGWGTNDTHAGPSNLQYGFDNWYYGMVGYSGFKGTVAGEDHRFGNGFFRFKLDAKEGKVTAAKLEFLRNTNNNSWGVGVSEDGQLFGSTANGNPSVHLPIPNRYYERVRGWSSSVLPGIAGNAPMFPITDRVRQVDHHGHFTAAAGHALYTARSYPREYWNRTAFVCEPTGHLIATFVLEPNGGTFRSRNAWNLLASDDEWTSPTMAEVGPDGSVWFIDWYNYIIQHNPTPPGFKTGKGNAYESELRDKSHGRIYRIVPAKAPANAPVSLKNASAETLIATLKDSNLLWRRHAQRLLVERRREDLGKVLVKIFEESGTDELGSSPVVIHSLWTLDGIDELKGLDPTATKQLLVLLQHPSPAVRRNVLQILPGSLAGNEIAKRSLLSDHDPQVRLQALLKLSQSQTEPSVAKTLVDVLQDPTQFTDPWLRDGLIAALAQYDAQVLSHLVAQGVKLPPPSLALVERIAEHHARGGPATTIERLLANLPTATESTSEAVLTGLQRGWPKGVTPEFKTTVVQDLISKLNAKARGQLFRLARTWNLRSLEKFADELSKQYLVQLQKEDGAEDTRLDAARQFVELRRDNAAAVTTVLDQITPRAGPTLTLGLLDAAALSDAKGGGIEIAGRLGGWTPTLRAKGIQILASKAEWTRALLDMLDQGKLPPEDLSLDQKQTLSSHPDKSVAKRALAIFSRVGGLPSPDRAKVVAEYMPLAKKAGDAKLGKLIFAKQCAKCHAHSGEGAHIGPDLTGMAVHPKEHLLTEILDPNKSVEGNYRQYLVTTASGKFISGLLASESKTAVELIDVEGKRHAIARDDIEEVKATHRSLMPEGFEKQVSREEFTHLLEFLALRGKYLPLPLDRAATIVSTKGMFNSEDAAVERIVLPDWKTKTIEGVPFQFVDPQGDRAANVILLYGKGGAIPPRMPKSVSLPFSGPIKAIHLLSGISGWGATSSRRGEVVLIVKLHYADGSAESHSLRNGVHFADYIRRIDVPGSKFAFAARSQQVRYLSVEPTRAEPVTRIEFVKGPDPSSPIIVAVTVENREK